MMTNDICVYRDTSLGDMNITSLNYNAGIDQVETEITHADSGEQGQEGGGNGN